MMFLRKVITWKPAPTEVTRKEWFCPDLNIRYHANFWWDLYKNEEGKVRAELKGVYSGLLANLYGSRTKNNKHLPIVDLDWAHKYVPSTNSNHAHLYLNVEIPHWRWVLLMWGLYFGRVISFAYLAWSLRRGQNFARKPGVKKTYYNSDGDPYEPSE